MPTVHVVKPALRGESPQIVVLFEGLEPQQMPLHVAYQLSRDLVEAIDESLRVLQTGGSR